MTAAEADRLERDSAAAAGRWTGDRCADHYEFLEDDGSCRECLDDAHERWLLSRTEVAR